jgi:hypothetical protein
MISIVPVPELLISGKRKEGRKEIKITCILITYFLD